MRRQTLAIQASSTIWATSEVYSQTSPAGSVKYEKVLLPGPCRPGPHWGLMPWWRSRPRPRMKWSTDVISYATWFSDAHAAWLKAMQWWSALQRRKAIWCSDQSETRSPRTEV